MSTGEGEPPRVWLLGDVAAQLGGIKRLSLDQAIRRARGEGDPEPRAYCVTENTGVRLWHPDSLPAWREWAARRLRPELFQVNKEGRSDKR
jgi:hypothetical protein